jgi:hypothetical protein
MEYVVHTEKEPLVVPTALDHHGWAGSAMGFHDRFW